MTDTTGQYDLYSLSYLVGPDNNTQKISPSNPIPASHWLSVGQNGSTALKASFRSVTTYGGSYASFTRFPIAWSGDGLTYSFNFSICTPGDRELPSINWGNRGDADSYPEISHDGKIFTKQHLLIGLLLTAHSLTT